MPYNGSGVYSLPTGYLAVSGATILASQHNSPLEDIRDSLSLALLKDGRSTVTGDLTFANGKTAVLGVNSSIDGHPIRRAESGAMGRAILGAANSEGFQDVAGFIHDDVTTPRTDITAGEFFKWRLDIRVWVSDLSGGTDVAARVQEAVNFAGSIGAELFFPAGFYRLNSKIAWPEGAHLRGPARAGGAYNSKSAWFVINHSGEGFEATTNTGSRSFIGLNTYRLTQNAPGGGFAAAALGYDIKVNGSQDLILGDICLLNATNGIQIIGNSSTNAACGRVTIFGIRGQPLANGIKIEHALDVNYLDDVHFWPLWSFDAGVLAYVKSFGEAFIVGRVDNPKWGRLFAWGYARTMHVIQSVAAGTVPGGTASKLHIDSLGCDNSSIGLLVDVGANGAAIEIDKYYVAGDAAAPTNEYQTWIRADNCNVTFGSYDALYTNSSSLRVDGTGNDVKCSRVLGGSIDMDSTGDVFLFVNTGNRLWIDFIDLSCPSGSARYGGGGIISTPDWREFGTTISAQTGSFTTLGTVVARFRRHGNLVNFMVVIPITTNGTAAGDVRATMPFNAAQSGGGSGRAIAGSGLDLSLTLNAGGNTLVITRYDNTYPGGTGFTLVVHGFYEASGF